ncbi:hypothetical protein M758_12G130900 [Ceratodon purpureus]|nr:hypothetical protein M758_12G130900 [Ceratodon purpureus]
MQIRELHQTHPLPTESNQNSQPNSHPRQKNSPPSSNPIPKLRNTNHTQTKKKTHGTRNPNPISHDLSQNQQDHETLRNPMSQITHQRRPYQ